MIGVLFFVFFFFQAEDGIRDLTVTGVQTCALPIFIAEGVETATQRERLIAFGCELGQGFLFAKALEPEAARALLAEQQQPGPKAADRKSTRLNSSHSQISYAVFCLKKKKTKESQTRRIKD